MKIAAFGLYMINNTNIIPAELMKSRKCVKKTYTKNVCNFLYISERGGVFVSSTGSAEAQ